jgi:hypothetical protein
MVGQIRLDPRRFGVAHRPLIEALQGFWQNELARAGLPSDQQLQQLLKLDPV